jgi:hypothetical protein
LADFVDKVAEARLSGQRCRNLFASNEARESQFREIQIEGIAFQSGSRVEAQKTFINNIGASRPSQTASAMSQVHLKTDIGPGHAYFAF